MPLWCNGELETYPTNNNRVLPLKPDFVIYYGATNDVRPQRERDRLIRLPKGLPEAATGRQYVRLVNKGRGFYFENSLIVAQFLTMVETFYRRSTADSPPVDLWDLEVKDYVVTADLYIRNLEAIHLLCETNGIRFLPITFIAESLKLPQWQHVGLPYFVDRLHDHWRRRDLPLIDVRPEFERVANKGVLFFPDHYHPSPDGAEFIACHAAAGLIPLIAELRITARRISQRSFNYYCDTEK